MIYEVATIDIHPGKQRAFENAVRVPCRFLSGSRRELAQYDGYEGADY
jgi:hypothetical protein